MRRRIISVLAVLLAVAGLAAPAAQACSRVTWLGPDGMVITGRSMDWPYSFNSHLYAIPRGLTQDGAGGVNSLTWTGKYGAIEVAGTTDPNGPIDGVFDGMNETGLVANLLYLGEADFGPPPTDNRPRLSFAAWVQYVLTMFSTVNEVVDAFSNPSIYIVPINFGPNRTAAPTVHLSVNDASGDSAIFEYLDGKVVVHHGRQYQVMTNSPTYDEQLALNAQWENQDRTKNLPGSIQSADRFVRASYFLSKLPQTTDERQAVAGVLSVIRNVSVPWGVGDPQHPNLVPHLLALGGRLDDEGVLLRVDAESQHRVGESEQPESRTGLGRSHGGRRGRLLADREHRRESGSGATDCVLGAVTPQRCSKCW